MTQPTALFLADVIDSDAASAAHHGAAAYELRRLHEEVERLTRERAALLEALRTLLSYAFTLEMRLLDADGEHRAMQKARAAIKAVEEEA